MENELIGTKWRYSVPNENSAYNDFYSGTWNVENVADNRVVLSQACTRHEGDCVFSTKKCTIVPMNKLNSEFKRARVQNIVVEEKPVSGNVPVGRGRTEPVPRYCPIMTNKDIQKTIDGKRRNAWTDDDIEKYLRSRGIGCEPDGLMCSKRSASRAEPPKKRQTGNHDEDWVRTLRSLIDLVTQV